MTDAPTTDTPEGNDQEPTDEAPEGASEAQEAVPEDDEVTRLRREAADRRVAARDAVARADALDAALTERIVAAATAGVLEDQADFARFTDGPVPRDEDGLPDEAAIRAAAEAIVEAHPRLGARRFASLPAGPQGADQPAPSNIFDALRSIV